MVNSEMGSVRVSKEVIISIIKLAATEIESVSNFTENGYKLNIGKMPRIEITDDNVKINLYISFYSGNDIKKEVEKVQENIKKSVENMLGLEVSSVNVYIFDITPKE